MRCVPVSCGVKGCSHVWPRDPVNTVGCPKCGAKAGAICTRPSGHNAWEKWGRFHMERDMAAAAAGKYHHKCSEPCPRTCGVCHPKSLHHNPLYRTMRAAVKRRSRGAQGSLL